MADERDGRWLAFFEFPDSGDTQRDADVKQAIVDALVPFAYHEKSPESAVSFLASVGVTGATVTEGIVVLPQG